MRVLWEIFTLCLAIAVLFALGRGFPAFGGFLRAVLFNPIGLLGAAAVTGWIVLWRHRASARRAADEGR